VPVVPTGLHQGKSRDPDEIRVSPPGLECTCPTRTRHSCHGCACGGAR
jgi:hypothetical protein